MTDSSTDRQTDKQTGHATRSVTIGRTYVRSTAMRPIIINNNVNNSNYIYAYLSPQAVLRLDPTKNIQTGMMQLTVVLHTYDK